jgi:hypothetical protein
LATVLASQTADTDACLSISSKIFAAIALLTVAALWLLFTTFFATERAEEKIEQHGAVDLVVIPA